MGKAIPWAPSTPGVHGVGGVYDPGTYANSLYGNREILRPATADGAVARTGNSNEVIR